MIPLIKKVFLLSTLVFLFACKDNGYDQQNTLVPRVNVNTTVPIDFIQIGGQFTTIPQGYKGIIIFNMGGNNFKAFDLGCPYIAPNVCSTAMTVDTGTGEMSCATCENDDINFTQYKTIVTIGENIYSLREYDAYLENGIVRITNF